MKAPEATSRTATRSACWRATPTFVPSGDTATPAGYSALLGGREFIWPDPPDAAGSVSGVPSVAMPVAGSMLNTCRTSPSAPATPEGSFGLSGVPETQAVRPSGAMAMPP